MGAVLLQDDVEAVIFGAGAKSSQVKSSQRRAGPVFWLDPQRAHDARVILVEESNRVQGKQVDLSGDCHPDLGKVVEVMRLSAKFNAALSLLSA